MASHFPENGGHRSSERTVVLHEIVRRRIIKLNVAVVSAWDHRRHLDGGKGLKMSPNICLSKNSFLGGGEWAKGYRVDEVQIKNRIRLGEKGVYVYILGTGSNQSLPSSQLHSFLKFLTLVLDFGPSSQKPRYAYTSDINVYHVRNTFLFTASCRSKHSVRCIQVKKREV